MFRKTLASALLAILVLTTMAIPTAAQSISARNDRFGEDDSLRDDLAGSWNVTASTPLQGQFKVLLTFTSDGAVIAAEPPSAYESAGHGNWKPTGRDKAAYTFKAFLGNDLNQLTGSIEVIGRLTYNENTKKWSGPFQVTVFDANGNVIFADQGTFSGSKIQIKSLN